MKKPTILLLATFLLILIILFESYQYFFKPIKSTDLSDLKIGNNVLSEIVKEKQARKLNVYVEEKDRLNVVIRKKEITTISEVKQSLGKNYQDRSYSSEQKLRKATYLDKELNTKVTFIYQSNLKKYIVWIEIEPYQ